MRSPGSAPRIPQSAALTGLARQLGGAFGIALASTYISHMSAFHRSHLVANLYSGNPVLSERLQGTAQMFVGQGYSPDAAQEAVMRLLDGSVQLQDYTMSVNNAFLMGVVLFVIAFPFVFLLKRTAPGAAVSAGH